MEPGVESRAAREHLDEAAGDPGEVWGALLCELLARVPSFGVARPAPGDTVVRMTGPASGQDAAGGYGPSSEQ